MHCHVWLRARFSIALTLLALSFQALCSPLAAADREKKLNEDINTRTLEGSVTDAAGKPVNGAIVQLTDMKTLLIRSYITHEDGLYHFAGLSTNVEYQVRAATEEGESSKTKTLSVFDSKRVASIKLKLKAQKPAKRG